MSLLLGWTIWNRQYLTVFYLPKNPNNFIWVWYSTFMSLISTLIILLPAWNVFLPFLHLSTSYLCLRQDLSVNFFTFSLKTWACIELSSPTNPECTVCLWQHYFIKKKKKIFRLCWVLVAACGIFSCSMQDLIPWPGIKPRAPALGVWSLSHWTTKEVHHVALFYMSFSFIVWTARIST